MLGSGMMWIPFLHCQVLDHLILSKQPELVNLISCLVRCRLQSNVEVEGDTRFDFHKNEKNTAVKIAPVKARECVAETIKGIPLRSQVPYGSWSISLGLGL